MFVEAGEALSDVVDDGSLTRLRQRYVQMVQEVVQGAAVGELEADQSTDSQCNPCVRY